MIMLYTPPAPLNHGRFKAETHQQGVLYSSFSWEFMRHLECQQWLGEAGDVKKGQWTVHWRCSTTE